MRLLSERKKGSRRAVDGRIANRNNSNENDAVHNTRQNSSAGALNSNNERACQGVCAALATQETGLVIGDEKPNKEKRNTIENGDAPKDLLDGGREGLSGVGSLSRGQTDQLGPGKGSGRCDDDGAEALEAMVKGTRVLPVLPANVAAFRMAANVYNSSEQTMIGQLDWCVN